MDSYAEQIVKKEDGGEDNKKRVLCLAGGIAAGILLIAAGSLIHLSVVGAVLGIAAFYGGLYMGTNYDVEYEYLIVNGEFDIHKILAKKRRKKMLTVKVSDFEGFGRYDDNVQDDSEATIIWALGTSQYEKCENYYADFNHETYGKCRLLFSPSVKVLREIKLYIKGPLKNAVGELHPEEEL